MIKLGILGSTRGTNLSTIVEAINQKKLNALIEIVISNKAEAKILDYAVSQQIKTQFIDAKNLTREAYDQQVSTVLQQYNVDLIVLIGYMRILSSDFVRQWKNKIINVHPSLLPAFSGLMDLQVHQAVIDSHAQETGCTVHYVTEAVDAGPIILQKRCKVLSTDTPQQLKERVQQLEGVALVEAIRSRNSV